MCGFGSLGNSCIFCACELKQRQLFACVPKLRICRLCNRTAGKPEYIREIWRKEYVFK
jgi:hypothetical protein